MNKVSKIILITLLIGICFMSLSNVYALTEAQINQLKPPDPTGYDNFFKKAGTVLGLVRNIGAVGSVLGIAVLGLRYMWGSVDEKANYKETMFPFIIGIAVTVGMTTIITIVQKVAEKI